ncbi:MAG: CHRD domain-containing protein [Rhodobacteraceae bacterium]|nr:CHRD domain-containing protein [Paracoccaceae bacterium]
MKQFTIAVCLLFACVMGASAQVPVERHFFAEMSALNQTKYTVSDATGIADFDLDLSTLTLSWNISFKGLSGPVTHMRLYGPAQPGANGAAMFDLAGKGATSPVTGSRVLTEAQIQYLFYGWTYLTVGTAKYDHGEIRGQLDVKPRLEEVAK